MSNKKYTKKLTIEEIKQKEQQLLQLAKEVKEKENISPAQLLLNTIKDTIRKLITEEKLSYTQISSIIYKTYNIKISTQTLRTFAHNVLQIPKNEKRSEIAKKVAQQRKQNTTATSNKEGEEKPSEQIKKQFANNEGEDTL